MRFAPRVSPVVDAVQVSRGTVPEVEELIEGSDLRVAYVDGATAGFKAEPDSDVSNVVVVGTKTALFAYEGEWLLRDATGNFRRLNTDEFASLYEPVL